MFSVAQNDGVIGDLQRLFQMMRYVDDRHAAARQVVDDLEEHFHLRRAQRRGRLVHDQDARIDGECPCNLDDLLLAEAKILDARQRIDVFLELFHQRPGLTLLFSEVDDTALDDLPAHENIVADTQIGGQAELLVNDRDPALARMGR